MMVFQCGDMPSHMHTLPSFLPNPKLKSSPPNSTPTLPPILFPPYTSPPPYNPHPIPTLHSRPHFHPTLHHPIPTLHTPFSPYNPPPYSHPTLPHPIPTLHFSPPCNPPPTFPPYTPPPHSHPTLLLHPLPPTPWDGIVTFRWLSL